VLPSSGYEGPNLVDLLDRTILSHWLPFKIWNCSDMRLRTGHDLG